MRVAVIGSGLGGLAAACTLAARGYEVEVFEKNPWLGGKAARSPGTGLPLRYGPHHPDPALGAPPHLLRGWPQPGRLPQHGSSRPAVALLLRRRQRARSEGRCARHGRFARSTANQAWATRSLQFMEMSEQLHAISDNFFFWKSVGSMWDTFDISGAFDLKVLKDVMRMRMGQTVAGTIREFIKDPNVAQMLDHFVQYVGSLARRLARDSLLYRPHAIGGGHLVSRRAAPAQFPKRWSSWVRNWASASHLHRHRARLLHRSTARSRGIVTSRRGTAPLRRRCLQLKTRCAPIANCSAALLPQRLRQAARV